MTLKNILKLIEDFGVVETWFSVVAGHPFDTVKTRLQTIGRIDFGQGEFLYNGSMDCFTKIIRREGVFSLYKGMLLPLISVVPCSLLTFSVFEILSLEQSVEELNTKEVLRNGALSGMIVAPLVSPLERIKFYLQIPKGYNRQIKSARSIITTILKNEGLKGFTRGTLLAILRDGIGTAIAFYAYWWLKFNFIQGNPRFKDKKNQQRHRNLKFLGIVISGGLAGVISGAITAPLDMIKTRYQFEVISLQELVVGLQSESMRRGIPVVRVCYSGLPFIMIRSCCQHAAMFFGLELYRELISSPKIVLNKSITDEETTTILKNRNDDPRKDEFLDYMNDDIYDQNPENYYMRQFRGRQE